MARHIVNIALVISLGLLQSSCDSGGKEKPKTKAAANAGDGNPNDGNTPGANPVAGDAAGGGGNKVFDTWCSKAGETKPVKKELKKFFEAFCDGDKPKALLSSTLINIAYSGSGDPKFKTIEKFSSDKAKKQTTGYLGVGIKLPIKIKDHFDKVGPKGGDVASLEKLAAAQGAEGTAEILDTYKKDGKYQVRGWKVHAKNTKDIGITKIVTETESRSDQFMLEEGKAYSYTQVTTDGIEGIKDFSLLTAGVQVGNDSYLITQAYIVVDNKGLPDIAEKQVKDTAKALIKSMYKAAKDEE